MEYFNIFFLVSLTGCKDELFIENESTPISTRAIPTPEFDWENCDWMPTPKGQSPIPSPWVGQGSIVSVYGIDVVNDRKASDGWLLLYNSFNSTATGPLVNPYFILYNKYRGLMRIFFIPLHRLYPHQRIFRMAFQLLPVVINPLCSILWGNIL